MACGFEQHCVFGKRKKKIVFEAPPTKKSGIYPSSRMGESNLDMSLVSLKNSSPLRSKGQSMLLHYKAVEFAERREGFIVPHCDQESARSSNVSGVWERGEETADSPRTFSLVSLGS